MANASVIHLSNIIWLLNMSHQKAYILTKHIGEFSEQKQKKTWERTICRKNDKSEQRGRREELEKGNRTMVLIRQTGKGHQTLPASQWGLFKIFLNNTNTLEHANCRSRLLLLNKQLTNNIHSFTCPNNTKYSVYLHKDLFSMFIIHDFEVNIRKCAALFFLVV